MGVNFVALERLSLASLVVQMVKNQPAMQETRVRYLGWEDSPGEGDSYPLQSSCLENSMDRGAYHTTVHRVAKTRTQLKQLSTLGELRSHMPRDAANK